jgi:hypothetical protein
VYTTAKGSIPLYQIYNTVDNNKCKSKFDDKLMNKKQKLNYEILNLPGKWKLTTDDSASYKKVKLTSVSQQNDVYSYEPQGPIWDSVNYSCAYDALFSILWNVWQENPTK